jgi:3-isopropylmalate/(R)-2-methylmalate dehydratase small subunit
VVITGKVWKFGDNIDTDRIAPGRYGTETAEVQAQHCLEGADADFTRKAKPGDIIVAGKNFGCGSSRERAPQCIKDFGIAAIIAGYYSRIFTRSSINIGLPILECADALDKIDEGDTVEIDFDTGTIKDLTNGQVLAAAEFPPFLQSLIQAGGLVNYTRIKLGKEPLAK